jgi:glycosyltransferase involved in cell wall biosynthesis
MSSVQPLKISIAMATYNGAKYLREQLDSFVAQTRLPDELVITDDCSTDNTIEIIQAFAATAPFAVRWEQNEKNHGYTGNFNHALMKTTGDLVFLSDQDDVWFPEKLAVMERYALENPEALVVMNDAALTDGNLNDTGLTKQGQIASAGMTDSSFVMGCCAVVRRELLDVCLPIPANYKGHDNWIVKMAEGVGRKRVVADVLQWYRRHEANESQFIANKTTKVTRGMVFRRSLANAIAGSDQQEQLSAACEQAGYFLEGVRKASRRADEPLASAFTEYSTRLEEHLTAVKRRHTVREKSRLMRLPAIFDLWRSGGYAKFSGMKSAVRDLLFR